MQKLNPKSFKLKAEIITPIHIDNWEIYDRLDYFVFDGWDVIQIVDRKWLVDCSKKGEVWWDIQMNSDESLFEKIIKSVEKGDFVELEDLKAEFYEKYFDKSYVLEEIPISKEALKHLTMNDKDYSISKNWIRWNLGEIKRFIRNKFWDVIIPWSTLKWLFRTMFLMWEKKEWNYITEAEKRKNLDKKNEEIKKAFSFIQFEDVVVKNPKLEIQWIKLATETGSIPLPVEVLIWWEIEIKINYDESLFKDLDIERLLKDYSFEVIWREERILDNFENFNTDLLDKLDSFYEKWNYPVKIWMYKKSLAYKIFWEEELEGIYEKLVNLFKQKWSIDFKKIYFDWNLEKFGFKSKWKKQWWEVFKDWFLKNRRNKPTKVVWQKLWIWDKSFYIDENQNPIWWISLEIDNW